ncbi:histidine kinase [Pseudomonas promysalinigenes]|uniref:Histidine kinase n=1 Tax=Pseudomonas promysalinigenes TaxID=485898 RepID=A0ABY6AVS5_9PSED|nr:histidine kinase [Pseudomonas promysalinigenes]UXH42281.1 histidine kinase [Pseudomonas promysalinigenes]
MDSSSHIDTLQDFLLDAQVLLTQSQECLQHLELIANDPDACLCLNRALQTLARRAGTLGLLEVAHYASALHQLLAPACEQQCLSPLALRTLNACLTLLAWQLELIDLQTGSLSLDTCEQVALLNKLAVVLDQPFSQTCAPGTEKGPDCVHKYGTVPAGPTGKKDGNGH